jgi:adenylate cyclase
MVEAEERILLQNYIKKHDIEDLVQMLVEGLLKDRPEVRPKEHWAHMLRVEQLRREHKDDVDAQWKEAESASEVPGRLLSKLFEASKRISSEIVPKDTIRIVIEETINLLNCDRVSLFVIDRRLDMLVLNASNLSVPIRISPGQGIAGHVFTTQETVNISDCYSDARFDQSVDKATGYRTKCLLTMPIIDFEGECMGVLQAINKQSDEFSQGEKFTHIDEILMENLTQHVSIALRNAEIYRAAIVTQERANALLQMIQSLSQDLGAQSTILTITMHAGMLVQADRCTVFLVDENKEQLWSVTTDSGKEIRIPKSKGIAGECATQGDLIVIADCYADERFNQEVDKKTGYKTSSMLAVPVLRRKRLDQGLGKVLAVIQMINKMEFDGEVGKFDDEDIQVMETFATFVAARLEGSTLLEKTQKKDTESEGHKAFGEVEDKARGGKRKEHGPGDGDKIVEEDEEEAEGAQ